jgi:hypothetical protein
MATIANIINLVKCGAGAVLGTGTKGCKPFLKKVSAIWLTANGFKFDGSRDLDEDYIKELQAEGKLIVLKGVRTFTDNSQDDTIDELEDGTKQVARLGLYEFMLEFINGLYFNAALNSLSSYGNYDILFIDREGNILGTKASDGSLKGVTAGMIQSQRLMWATDSQAQRERLAFQLLERSEIDKDYVFIQREQLDFNPGQVDGINEVVLSYAVAPSDLDTQLTIKAVTKQDGKAFTGADYSDFLVKVNGATNNPTAGDDSATAGTYVLTGISALATNDVVVSELYDNVNSRDVITLDTDLYKSDEISATVV